MIQGTPLLSSDHPSPHALIRCDGSPELGMGHVVRCLALADALREMYGWQVSFLMRQGPLGFDAVQKSGYVVLSPEQGGDAGDAGWLSNVLSRAAGDVLVCDVRDDLQKETLIEFRKWGLLIALLDDLTERRLAADMVFYPPIPQLDGLDWKDYGGRVFVGWEWVVLRRDVRKVSRRQLRGRTRIVITMGGSDPSGFTLKAVQAVEHVRHDVEIVVVLGPGFRHCSELSERVVGIHRTIDIRTQVSDLPEILAQADLVVGAFGTTAYELAVLGVPAVFLCASADHAESARALTDAGFGVSLGLGSEVNERALAEVIDQEIIRITGKAGMIPDSHPVRLIDGFGAERVAEQLVRAVKERHRTHHEMAVS